MVNLPTLNNNGNTPEPSVMKCCATSYTLTCTQYTYSVILGPTAWHSSQEDIADSAVTSLQTCWPLVVRSDITTDLLAVGS